MRWTGRQAASKWGLSLCVGLGLAACGSPTAPASSGSTGLSGAWVGKATQPNGPLTDSFTYRMQLTQSGSQVTGTSHSESPAQPQFFADFTVSGTMDPTTNTFTFQEDSITNQVAPPDQFWCLKSGSLQFSSSPRRLAGNWTAPGCVPGTMDLSGQ